MLFQVDDWEVLYVDGKNVAEGHRIDVRDIMNALVGEDNYEIKWYEYDTKVAKRATYDLIPDTLEELERWEKEDWEPPH